MAKSTNNRGSLKTTDISQVIDFALYILSRSLRANSRDQSKILTEEDWNGLEKTFQLSSRLSRYKQKSDLGDIHLPHLFDGLSLIYKIQVKNPKWTGQKKEISALLAQANKSFPARKNIILNEHAIKHGAIRNRIASEHQGGPKEAAYYSVGAIYGKGTTWAKSTLKLWTKANREDYPLSFDDLEAIVKHLIMLRRFHHALNAPFKEGIIPSKRKDWLEKQIEKDLLLIRELAVHSSFGYSEHIGNPMEYYGLSRLRKLLESTPKKK